MSNSPEVLDFLRYNEAALNAAREYRVGTPSNTASVKGWAASRGQLLEKTCRLITGRERSLALEKRWSRLLVKVDHAYLSELVLIFSSTLHPCRFCWLSTTLLSIGMLVLFCTI